MVKYGIEVFWCLENLCKVVICEMYIWDLIKFLIFGVVEYFCGIFFGAV